MQDNENDLSILETIAKTVQKLGADDCDAMCVKSISLSIGQRMGSMEKIERSESSDIGVRVFIGQKTGNRLIFRRNKASSAASS